MQVWIRRLSVWAYQSGFMVGQWRARRMLDFVKSVRPPSGARIIDLGGTDYNWNLIDHDYRVTIVNLPETGLRREDTEKIKWEDGDATDLRKQYDDGSFDVVFSNSVIEHLGGDPQETQFRNEVYRLAPAHWIQTPSNRFPIEAHTGVPYYWRLPGKLRNRLHARWEKNLPEWFAMIQGTSVLSRQRMKELFHRSDIYTERVMGLEKSYAAYLPFSHDDGRRR